MKVVICGGGIAGSYLVNSLAGHIKPSEGIESVTLIEPKAYFEATNGVLGAIHHPNYKEEFKYVSRSGEWAWDRRVQHVASTAATIDSAKNLITLENGDSLPYDVLCICTGSKSANSDGTAIWRPQQHVTTLEARMEEISQYREKLSQAKTVLIIGGGVVGVELISELAERYPKTRFHYAVADPELLLQFKSVVRTTARRHIERLSNVELHFNCGRISEPSGEGVYRIGNFEVRADIVIRCFASGVNTQFVPTEWLDERKQIKVDSHLNVEGVSNVFAVGDACNNTTDKSAKVALDQAAVVRRNILSQCRQKEVTSVYPGPRDGLVIRLGPRESLMYFKPLIGLYGITMSGSYLADVVRIVLLAKIIYQCTTGESSNLIKGPIQEQLKPAGA